MASVSVSLGQGSTGGVVGAGVGDQQPDVDVTVGSNKVVGNAPPSQGTGIALGGRFFNPPPSAPVPPG